jgi:quercetin dioxygenase-like cupin family protein
MRFLFLKISIIISIILAFQQISFAQKPNLEEGQLKVIASEIIWKPCPSHLPKGCEIAVIEGSPKEADFFTVRFKMTGEFLMPAHTHPKDERVTILEGKVYVAFGLEAKKEDASVFGPGDFYVNYKNAIHTVWADKGSILQITGIGPWEANFIEE